MRKSIRMFVLGVSVCMLMIVADAGAKDKLVPRPLKMMVQSQQVINLTNGSLVAHAEGVSSHLGSVTMDSAGTVSDPIFYGTITAANGDLIYWEWEANSILVTITGGTGRFEGAQGEFIMDITPSGQKLDPVSQTMTLTFVWTATGTIYY
jgi:hypothetical protein